MILGLRTIKLKWVTQRYIKGNPASTKQQEDSLFKVANPWNNTIMELYRTSLPKNYEGIVARMIVGDEEGWEELV